MQQSTQIGRLKLIKIMIMAPLSYLSPHSHKNSVSSKSFSQVETGSAVANEICGENSGSHMYLEVKVQRKNIRNIIEKASEYHRNTLGETGTCRWKALRNISLKRHLNTMGKFWIAHVLGGRNIYFGVKK